MNAIVLAVAAVVATALVVGVVRLRRSRALRRRQRQILAPPARRRTATRSWSVGGLLAVVASGPAWRAVTLSFGAAAALGYLLGGVVAAVILGAYATVATVSLRRRRGNATRRAARSALLDRLTGLAADLRAGVPIATAVLAAETADATAPLAVFPEQDADQRLASLARAAVTLAERTGAPLADLVDRIEADARAGDRARDAAAAQAAGAQATAMLLAALPIGGLALGYAIGADSLAILLRTPLGAVCALCAVTLQILGLVWSQRLQPRLS
ncbi:type II secretion system F family protein [Asanoa siamensis]|uniref:Tight adherence protein B n=1 Tax=Asanoa siamensis TaxID=926357 RepID=A0ABQ4CRZ2_9ACTN|nr:hypothetical protein [Asanoa siamensis]GIF74066.1 hypothetical protein Asi02nite_35840 [Asanoa siamensis]